MPEACHARQDPKHILVVEALRSGHVVRLKARGTSMLPSIWPRDTLTLQSATAADVRVGDIVLIADGDRFFIHRFTRIQSADSGEHLVTRGDSVPHEDPTGPSRELLGKVTSIERAGRVLVPNTRRSLSNVVIGGLLSRSVRLLQATLYFHSSFCRARRPEAVAIQETQV
jgi:hypothetical protein